MNMKRKLKVWWRWLSQPVPPEGMKYADNPNLPGFAPTNVQPDTQQHIDEVQTEMLAHQGREFFRLNEMQNKIAKHIHANYGEDQASGLHARIGGDLSDLVIYYLRRERWLQAQQDRLKKRSEEAMASYAASEAGIEKEPKV